MKPPRPVTRTLRPPHDSDRSALRDGTKAIYSGCACSCVSLGMRRRAGSAEAIDLVAGDGGRGARRRARRDCCNNGPAGFDSRVPSNAPASRPGCRCSASRTFRSGWRPPMHHCRAGYVDGCASTCASSTSCWSKTFTARQRPRRSSGRRAGVPYVLQAMATLPTSPERGGQPSSGRSSCCGRGDQFAKPAACLYLSESERHEYLAQGADPTRSTGATIARISSRDGIPRSNEPSVVYLGQSTRSNGSTFCSRPSHAYTPNCPRLDSR